MERCGGLKNRRGAACDAGIHIEASAALTEWIDLCRADPGGGCYEQLVNWAVSYLPMPNSTSRHADFS